MAVVCVSEGDEVVRGVSLWCVFATDALTLMVSDSEDEGKTKDPPG